MNTLFSVKRHDYWVFNWVQVCISAKQGLRVAMRRRTRWNKWVWEAGEPHVRVLVLDFSCPSPAKTWISLVVLDRSTPSSQPHPCPDQSQGIVRTKPSRMKDEWAGLFQDNHRPTKFDQGTGIQKTPTSIRRWQKKGIGTCYRHLNLNAAVSVRRKGRSHSRTPPTKSWARGTHPACVGGTFTETDRTGTSLL